METLFENKDIKLDLLPDGDYHITYFNEYNHWRGDFAFNKDGIVYDYLTEKEEF